MKFCPIGAHILFNISKGVPTFQAWLETLDFFKHVACEAFYNFCGEKNWIIDNKTYNCIEYVFVYDLIKKRKAKSGKWKLKNCISYESAKLLSNWLWAQFFLFLLICNIIEMLRFLLCTAINYSACLSHFFFTNTCVCASRDLRTFL